MIVESDSRAWNPAAGVWLESASFAQYDESMAHLDDAQRATFAALSWHRAMLAARGGTWPASFW